MLALAASRPPAGAGGRLICVDGPAGSGKTTLAAALARASGAQVVHVDDVLDGWGGLPGLGARLEAVVRPWVAGADSRYERYDWHAGRFAQTVPVPAAPLLVVEGVGSGQSSYAVLVTVLVWVTAPPELRLARGLERDGAAMASRWRQWQLDEAAHFERERTAERADVVISG